ncbi:methionine synthase [Aureibacillus halotolerans]|uniref:Methionine synthase n=1 Tax=Aureibacillus halotolerans TaxID=1508390 RepID=A0A4R6U702_9BACI|nr:methionine synthase [Aureibacillus halotolerans]TDQ42091.1 methionine synthase (B12-dependent) [Aureibacillus halotolerans]
MTTTIANEMQKRILILDGAMGTMIQNADLSPEDFGGEEYDGCNEYLNLTKPEAITAIHEGYLAAGADIIATNTFGATSIVLDDYDLGTHAFNINKVAAELAVTAAQKYSTSDHQRFVAGALGPTTKTLSVTGGTTFEHLVDCYQEQVEGLIAGRVDLILLETSQDMLNVKAAYVGMKSAFEKTGVSLPLFVSGTIEPMGTTLAGQTIEAFYLSLEHMNPTAVGLNCATGPEFMRDHVRSLSSLAASAVSCYPNAGLPDEEGNYHESPESIAKKLGAFAEKGWLNVAGGCCGTTPDHIAAIANEMQHYAPRLIPERSPQHMVSGIDPLIYDDTMRPLMVGERTNVIGSRKFKRLIAEGAYEDAAEIARAQVKGGAHVIDVCLADPDREELEDMEKFLYHAVKKVKVPLVIDSTDELVIEKALRYSQGKAIINSINLEDGEERFEAVIPIVKEYGAAVVVGTIDETGMAVTAERKLEIAMRSHDLLVEKYGLRSSDIIFDPLVFPIGTGDEQYIGSAEATIEGIRMIKEALPECLTILGISNVSFGLPPVGREVLNAVYLYHCTQAGLDYAIVNTEKLERYASIPKEEIALADKLLYETTDATLAAFTEKYRGKKKVQAKPTEHMSLDERLQYYIVEGTKDGLTDDLGLALNEYETPLAIINGPLMTGMAEVGRLFNDNQLIVAEVLQSAEAMKSAVAFLEPHMEANGGKQEKKAKILLATVKGDVHDIGKNLVDIILTNNGFDVVDLGIKVTPETLIQAVQKEHPDMIGLSGLLVKSAQQMVITAQDLKQSGIDLPILVGGAALSRKFTNTKISNEYDGLVLYAKDAMNGLSIANRLQKPEERTKIKAELEVAREKAAQPTPAAVLEKRAERSTQEAPGLDQAPVFIPQDTDQHVLKEVPTDHLMPYVNWQMLLGHHLGLKGRVDKLLESQDQRTLDLKEKVQEVMHEAAIEETIKAAGLYRFFPAQSDGNTLLIYDPADQTTVINTFDFPRQEKPPFLCLADYVRPASEGVMDYVALMAVTAGSGVRERSQAYKEAGEYFKSHALQSVALELAEGFAERLHQLLRDQWGFPDPVDLGIRDLFSAKYQGQRFSFGYPACPNLEDQEKLFKLLSPEKIGIHLTEGFMMEPEASVTAIVFSHPQARYFNVH